MTERIAVQNVNHPGKTNMVDAAKYRAMRDAVLAALPAAAPGLSLVRAQGGHTASPPGGRVSWRRHGRLVDQGGAAGSGSQGGDRARDRLAPALASPLIPSAAPQSRSGAPRGK